MNGPSYLPEVPGRGKFSTWPASNEFFINHTHDILEAHGGDRASCELPTEESYRDSVCVSNV